MIRDLWSMTDRRSRMTLVWLIALATLAALAQGAAVVALLPGHWSGRRGVGRSAC